MSTPVERPRFAEAQVVAADTLEAEQDYRVAMRSLHDSTAHSWGIASGLALEVDPRGVVVAPGVALDGNGRSLVVRQPVRIPAAALDEVGHEIDVWLVYSRKPAAERPNCGAESSGRWREEPSIHVTRAPSGERPRDLGSRVYLGRARAGEAGYSVEHDHRVYAGLTGERIVHPAGIAALDVRDDSNVLAFEAAAGQGARAKRVTVSATGATTLHGPMRVDDDLVLAGEDDAAAGLKLELVEPPKQARPWSLYRTRAKDATGVVEQLRIEIGNPAGKGDPKRDRLVVGRRQDGRFVPFLVVSANRDVEILGELSVNGMVVQGPAPADPANRRFAAAALAARLKGIATAAEGIGG